MGLLDDAIREHLDLKRRSGADPAEVERLEREALGPVRRDATGFASESSGFAAEPAGFTDEPTGPELSSAGFADVPADHDDAPAAYGEAPLDPGALEEFDELEPDAFATERHEFDPAPAAHVEDEPEPETPRGGIASPDYADPEFDDFTAERSQREPRHRFGFLHRRHHHHEPPAERDREAPRSEPEHDLAPVTPAPETGALPGSNEPPMLRITPEANLGETVEYDVERAFAEEARTGRTEPAAAESARATPAGAEPEEDLLEETPDFLADTPDHDRLWFEQKPPPDFDFE